MVIELGTKIINNIIINKNIPLNVVNTVYYIGIYKIYMMNKIILILILIIISGTIIISIVSSSSFSELYRNFDGSYINQETYEYNVMICSELQQKNGIDKDINCLEWTLTQEGNQRINEYLHFRYFGE